jgi:hypothetical protein
VKNAAGAASGKSCAAGADNHRKARFTKAE